MSNVIGIVVSADGRKAIAQLKAVGGEISSLGSKGTTTANRLTGAGAAMTRGLTIPLAVAGGAATKLAIDFDQSMNHIQALVGANTKQMDYYRKSILALAPVVGKGPKELADSLYFITSSGFKGAAALKVLRASAEGSAAGLGDTQTIADLATSAMNVYGHSNLSASQAVDILTTAVKDGKGEPEEYASSLGRVIPIAQNLGVSFDQVSAALASLTLGGFSADKATTGIASIFTNLAKPSASAKTALHSVGLSAAEIRDEITKKGLLPALMDLNKAFDGNQVELRKVFTSGKAIVPFLSLTGQAAKTNVGIFNDLAHATGATQQAFNEAGESDQQKLNKALAQLQVTGIQVGTQLVPVLIQVAGAAGDVASAFDGLSPGTQRLVIDAGLAAAALGPLTSGLGNAAKAGTALYQGSRLLTGATIAEGSGALAAGGAFTILAAGALGAAYGINQANTMSINTAGEFTRATAAVDGLAGAFRTAQNATSAHRNALLQERGATLAVKEAHKALGDYLAGPGHKGTLEYKQLLLGVKQAQQSLRDAIRNTKQTQQDQVSSAKQYHTELATTEHQASNITKVFSGLAKAMGGFGKDTTPIIEQYSQQMGTLSKKEYAAAAAMKALGDNAGSKLAGQLALAHKWASALAVSLNDIPTNIDVEVAIHGAAIDKARGEGTNKYHGATGAIVTKPTVALIGEAGPEAVVPLSGAPGARALPAGRSRRRDGAGSQVVINFSGPILGDRREAEAFAKRLAPLIDAHIRQAWARSG